MGPRQDGREERAEGCGRKVPQRGTFLFAFEKVPRRGTFVRTAERDGQRRAFGNAR